MYILQEWDYLKLYPFFQPEQIKAEFGGRALSARSIARIFNKHYKASMKTQMAKMLKASYAVVDIEANDATWNEYVGEELKRMSEERLAKVWDEVSQIEAILG